MTKAPDPKLVADLARDSAELFTLRPEYQLLDGPARFRTTVESCALLIAAQFQSQPRDIKPTIEMVEALFGKTIMAGLVLTYYIQFVEMEATGKGETKQ